MSADNDTPGKMASGPRGVIVTGGGSGIGRATARAFAARGDAVLVVGRTESALVETAKTDDSIRVLPADLTRPDVPELIARTALAELGRIDVLVNNAAAAVHSTLADADLESADTVFRTNLLAPVFVTRSVLDALEETGGTVVNISTSGSLGRRSWPGSGLYGAAKTALDFLTRTWAVELAPRGIRVIGVAPGVVNSGIGLRMGMSAEQYAGFLDQMSDRVPAGRVGTTEDVAWWITRLTEPGAAYATGAIVPVDGGLSLT